jgi:phosphate transport system substrate-binding protein
VWNKVRKPKETDMKRLQRMCRSSLGAGMLAAAALAGPAADPADAQGARMLRGQIEIDGSSTVYPISEAAASKFREQYPNVKVTVAISGTGGGFKRFVVGETDISDASRPITATEYKRAANHGVKMIELPVGLDGLSIVVHPDNDWVDKLTVDQIRQIYLEKHSAQQWSDLDPSWPDKPIKVYSPGTDSGTFDYFHEVVGEDQALRPDMSTSEDDNVLVTGVSGDKHSIGYFGASYYYNNKRKLEAVPVVNPHDGEAYLPTENNVNSGNYVPFSRPLFIYINAESLSRPEMKVFAEFYLKHAGEVAEQVDYVACSREIYDRARRFLENGWTGTTYTTPDGEKRAGRLPQVYQRSNLLKLENVDY